MANLLHAKIISSFLSSLPPPPLSLLSEAPIHPPSSSPPSSPKPISRSPSPKPISPISKAPIPSLSKPKKPPVTFTRISPTQTTYFEKYLKKYNEEEEKRIFEEDLINPPDDLANDYIERIQIKKRDKERKPLIAAHRSNVIGEWREKQILKTGDEKLIRKYLRKPKKYWPKYLEMKKREQDT
jgi:hypothetical protein